MLTEQIVNETKIEEKIIITEVETHHDAVDLQEFTR